MFNRIGNSWQLVKASGAVLRADKELLIFPVLSGITSLLAIVAVAVPAVLTGILESLEVKHLGFLEYSIAFLFYLVLYFIAFFFNTALVGAALIRLDGGNPTLGDGLRIAFSRVFALLGYAAIAATVGVILRAISERSGWIGNLVISMIGFVWSLATFLVVPILAAENVGPVEAIKRSSRLLKRTWGEQIMGNLSIGLVFGLFGLLVILAGAGTITTLAMEGAANEILVAVGALFLLALIGLQLLSVTLTGIYTAAVYRFAKTGKAGKHFPSRLMKSTFRPK